MREVLEYSPADKEWSGSLSSHSVVKRLLLSAGLLSDTDLDSGTDNHASTPYPFEAQKAWEIAHTLPIERTLDPEAADYQIKMPYFNSASGNNFWDTQPKDEIVKILGKSFITNEAKNAQEARARAMMTDMWWLDFNNTDINTSNPFNNPVVEQFLVNIPDDDALDENGTHLGWKGGEVNILNFGPELGSQQLRGLVDSIGLFAQCSRGDSLRKVPFIVIHENFVPRHFAQTNTTAVPAGLARFGRPYIEISNASLRSGDRKWATTVPVHEMFHQLDQNSYFASRFSYKDINRDGINDHAVTLCGGQCVGKHNCGALVLHNDPYALTNAREDGASASEATLSGEFLDPHRRDACIDYLNLIMRGSLPIVCDLDPGSWTIERNTGSDIVLPKLTDRLLYDPIRLYFTDQAARNEIATRHGTHNARLLMAS